MSWNFTARGDDYDSTIQQFAKLLKADPHLPPGHTRNIIEASAKVLALTVPRACLTAINCHGHVDSNPDNTVIGLTIHTSRPDPVMGRG